MISVCDAAQALDLNVIQTIMTTNHPSMTQPIILDLVISFSSQLLLKRGSHSIALSCTLPKIK